MSKLQVPVKRVRKGVELPEYATEGSVGLDLAAAVEVSLTPGELALIPTGLVVQTPSAHMLMLVPRSSTYKKFGITMPHSFGVIDQDYSGYEDELLLQFVASAHITIPAGTKIAQMIFIPITKVGLDEDTAMSSFAQSRGGFGSTDA